MISSFLPLINLDGATPFSASALILFQRSCLWCKLFVINFTQTPSFVVFSLSFFGISLHIDEFFQILVYVED